MNEISHQDPYVYTLSSRYMIERNFEQDQIQGTFNLNELQTSGHDTNAGASAIDDTERKQEVFQKVKYSQFLEKAKNDIYCYYDNKIFYGVVLNKMQKQLVIRTPYVFFNRTLLTLEIIIKKLPHHENIFTSALRRDVIQEVDLDQPMFEKVRFVLGPGEKFPLDPMYYYQHSICVRVFDQNSVAIDEGQDQQQMSVYKNARSSQYPGSQGSNNQFPQRPI